MTERTDEWPRIHSCLYNWCPKQGPECDRCNGVIGALHTGSADERCPRGLRNSNPSMLAEEMARFDAQFPNERKTP